MIAKLGITLNLLLGCCLYGQGNVVTDWATIVQPAVNTPPRLPGIQFVLHATIQLAVYDAVMAIEAGYEPFLRVLPAPVGADVRAAVATAAYVTARARVDTSQYAYLDTHYARYMAAIPAGAAKNDGVQVVRTRQTLYSRCGLMMASITLCCTSAAQIRRRPASS